MRLALANSMSVRVLVLSAITFVFWLFMYAVVRQVFPGDIIFYQGLLLIIIALILVTLVGSVASVLSLPTGVSADGWVLSIIISGLAMYAFHITVPSLLDRSISLYILGLTEEGSAFTESDYRECFVRGFIEKNGAIEKRLAEQKRTGNLVIANDGRHQLTPRGTAIHAFNDVLVRIFNTDRRYVNPGLSNNNPPK